MNAHASPQTGLKLGIRSKILLFGGLPTLLVLLAVILVAIGNMYWGLLEVTKDNIETELRSTASRIDRSNLESSIVPQVMSIAQEAGMFGKREESLNFAEQILKDFPSFTGAYFGYEPNADLADAAFSLEGAIREGGVDEQGRFIPYFWRALNDPNEIALEPLVNMEISYYYQGVKNRVLRRPEAEGIEIFQTDSEANPLETLAVKSEYYKDTELDFDPEETVMITEPYIYKGKLIVEQTYPIVIDDEFKGIAGVDRALADLQNFIAELNPYQTSDFFLISRRGRIIASTVEGQKTVDGDTIQIETRTIETAAPFSEHLIKAYKMEQDFDMFEVPSDPQLGGRFFYAAARIPTGDWTLVMRVARAEVLQPVRHTVLLTSLVALLGVVVVLLILIWLSSTISKRLSSASQAAERVADGDLTVDIDTSTTAGGDESATLLRAIHRMVEQLNTLLGKVKQASIQVMSTTTQLNATSSQQERVVNDFGASTTEIAAAVKEISATSQQLVRTMDDVKGMVEGTAGLANDGRSRIEGMENAMRSLADATASISEKLSVISEKANNIGAVVTAITKVADQTNLLSLNAAIEAEKAGEYGLGFAVVAREIRRLADQTAVATLDIEQMVKEMQGSVSSGVMEIDRFTEEVRNGVSETVETSEQFGRILEQVQGLTPRFEMVYEGMQSQSQGAEQISQAMGQLTDAAKRSSGSLDDLKNASKCLQDAVEELKQEVSRFQVR